MNWTRRNLLKAAMTLPAGLYLASYRALAAPAEKMVKITAIKALQLDNVGDGCIVRVETDAGVVGYGEAGCTAKMARARLDQMQRVWMGADPLAIENLFYKMTAPQNAFIPQVGLVSGIDIALWDIAGKVLGRPIYRLLGGPVRPVAPLYSHGNLKNMLDPEEAKDWAQKVRAAREGFRTFKFGIPFGERGGSEGPWVPTADRSDIKKVGKAYANIRNAAGDDIDIAMHGLGQFDLPTAIGLAKAIEPIGPAWFEDPLNYIYTESWEHLKRATSTPILTGEKVELLAGFKPYLDNGAVDIVHPDPAYAGGITGIRKIADYAAATRVPIACHSGPCSLVRFYASLHIAGSTQNFFRIENSLGEFRGFKEKMAAPGTEPVVSNSSVGLPTGPGLGLQFNEDWMKEHTAKGETYWG